MLIRSQDKKTLVNLDNVARITIEHIRDSDYRIAAGYIYIGTYSTEEKAIKVLDMIQKEYRKETDLCHDTNILFCVPKNIVFQMPQDSEV